MFCSNIWPDYSVRVIKNSFDKEPIVRPFRIKWYVGDENPFRNPSEELNCKLEDEFGISHPLDLLFNSKSITAEVSGKELELIRTHFQNILFPINKVSPVVWFDETAKFLSLNFEFLT